MPPKTNEDLMNEWNKKFAHGLSGFLHADMREWTYNALTDKDKQREEAVAEARRELAKTLLHHLQECEYGQAFGVLDKVIASSPTN